jgi:hypothetical protein
MFIWKKIEPKSQSLHQIDNGKTLEKAIQSKNRSLIKAWLHFDSIFPGLQPNYPNLMPRTKSRDVRMARSYNCAS